MKTASVRDLRLNFPTIKEWIVDGETVAVTMRRKVIAHLVPEPAPKRNKVATPDFAAISQKIFGKRTFHKSAMDAERKGYQF